MRDFGLKKRNRSRMVIKEVFGQSFSTDKMITFERKVDEFNNTVVTTIKKLTF